MDQAEYLRLKRQQESPFAALYEAARLRDADLTADGRRPVLGGLLSKEPVAGVDTIEYEGIKSMLLGLLSPAAKAFDAPLAAYQGNIPMEDMTAEALGTAGTVMGGGLAASGRNAMNYDPNTARIFLGPNAKGADQAALRKAKEMSSHFADRDEILNETGWFQGADQKWRFEVDDRDIDLRSDEASNQIADDMFGEAKGLLDDVKFRNAELKIQPDFFPDDVKRMNTEARTKARAIRQEADSTQGPRSRPDYSRGQKAKYAIAGGLEGQYPEMMRDVSVFTGNDLNGYLGSFGNNELSVSALRSPPEQRSTLLHELQHSIQDQEGFARGGSPRRDGGKIINDAMEEVSALNQRLRNISKSKSDAEARGDALGAISADNEYNRVMREKLEVVKVAQSDPFDIYRSLAGEVEARNVQTRQNFTPEQRAARTPWSTEDIPSEDQRVIFNEGKSGLLTLPKRQKRANEEQYKRGLLQ